MRSIWEERSFTTYDYIIIGSGIVGLSTAISLKERAETSRVLILERGIFPAGASTRNAGFACIGSLTETLDDLSHMTAQQVVEVTKMRKEGLEQLRSWLGDKQMDYQEEGSYELMLTKDLPALDRMEEINELLFPLFHKQVYEIASGLIDAFGFSSDHVKAMVINHCEGQLDTGMMMRALLAKARAANVELINGAEVQKVADESGHVEVLVKDPVKGQPIRLKCAQLGICTNAFASELIPELVVQPGRGQILVTGPIENLKFKGIFHFDRGYYYFRNFQNRILFGGGRNLDFTGEQTIELAINERIIDDLETKLRKWIIPGTSFSIAHRWSGIMGFGESKLPILQSISPRIHAGVKMGGMGVAIGSSVGRSLATTMMG